MQKDPFSSADEPSGIVKELRNHMEVARVVGEAAPGMSAAEVSRAYAAGIRGGPEAARQVTGDTSRPQDAGMRAPAEASPARPSAQAGASGAAAGDAGMRPGPVGARVATPPVPRVMNAPRIPGK